MTKPGIKEVRKNEHKIDINGILLNDDGKLKVDISEKGDGSELEEIKSCFINFVGENITITLKKVEVIEDRVAALS